MTSSFIAWPNIGKLHDAQRNARGATVVYRSKLKLHGTNAAIRVDSVRNGGKVTAQSRNRDLEPGKNDNFGFATWVAEQQDTLKPWDQDRVLYGEWYGAGIQQSCAFSQLKDRHFAVFAALYGEQLIVSPSVIAGFIDDLPAFVLPWSSELAIDFKVPDPEVIAAVNAKVESIDAECPWALSIHGVKGFGEGLVFFPMTEDRLEGFGRLAWKAKGKSHRTSSGQAAQVKPPPSSEIVSFVLSVLTTPRLEQALREVGGLFVEQKTGDFLRWIMDDIQRECVGELEASALDWKDVRKQVGKQAAYWYKSGAAA